MRMMPVLCISCMLFLARMLEFLFAARTSRRNTDIGAVLQYLWVYECGVSLAGSSAAAERKLYSFADLTFTVQDLICPNHAPTIIDCSPESGP